MPHRLKLLSRRTAVILDLAAVVVSQHVVGKNHVALAGQVDREARHRGEGLIFQPPVSPMSVGGQDSREGALLPQRTVEIPGDEKPRIAFKEDLLDGIVPFGNLPEDPRLERALLHRRPQPGADLYLPPQIAGPPQPGLFGEKRLEGIRQVQVAYPGSPPVHLRQAGQRLGAGKSAQKQKTNTCKYDLFRRNHGCLAPVTPSAGPATTRCLRIAVAAQSRLAAARPAPEKFYPSRETFAMPAPDFPGSDVYFYSLMRGQEFAADRSFCRLRGDFCSREGC